MKKKTKRKLFYFLIGTGLSLLAAGFLGMLFNSVIIFTVIVWALVAIFLIK